MKFIKIKNSLFKIKFIDKIYVEDKTVVVTYKMQSTYIYYSSSIEAKNVFYELCEKFKAI